jgi:16S rRNA (guanine527-N7)-methyltransferase
VATDGRWVPPTNASAQARELLRDDPLHEASVVQSYFGDRFAAVCAFAELLAVEGERRGLLGPREYDRLWERHIMNSAAIVPHLPAGNLADVGSGAGLPGLVVASMEPDRPVTLIEPMERRTVWLRDSIAALGLENVRVVRARAEEVGEEFDVVTARAVAALDKLVKWCSPLLADGGSMVLLKGRSAADEIERARFALRKVGMSAQLIEASTLPGLDSTTVVRVTRLGHGQG